MNACAVTQDLERHLAEIDRKDAKDAMIDRRTADLLLTKYDSTKTDIASEALAEMSELMADEIAIQLGHIVRTPNVFEKMLARREIGEIVERAIAVYCEAKARKEATRSVENAECKRCFDDGCNHCDPVEPY